MYHSLPRLLLVVVLLHCFLIGTVLSFTAGKFFDKIFIIVFENNPITTVMQQPYFRELATEKGALLDNYYGVTHPSQPNYLSMIAGEFYHHSDAYFDIDAKTVVDLLEAKNITWKAYQEDYPGNTTYCYDGERYKDYARKHNPFMTFTNVRKNSCHKIVHSDQLAVDVKNGQLPQYMFYTPNLKNDAHDTNAAYADKFLQGLLPPLLSNEEFMKGTLIFITWDEDNYIHLNHIYSAVIGSMVQSGAKDKTFYNHYSLLKTVEENWDLGSLGRHDDSAASFNILKH